jgi:hypothetical protein
MAQYDPQRSRSRHRKADDEGPAPVDALLGPDPAAGTPAVSVDPPAPDDSGVKPPADAVAPAGPSVPDTPRPDVEPVADWEPVVADARTGSPAWRPAVWLAAVLALLALLWLVVRRRNPGRDEPSSG